MMRTHTLLFLLLVTGYCLAMDNLPPYQENPPTYTENPPSYEAAPPTYTEVDPYDTRVVAPNMGHLIQLLGDMITPRSLQSTLSPNRRAITKDYFTDGLGAAIIMKHDNPGKEIVKPFHVHARLLGIATPMGFFPCYSPQNTQGNIFTKILSGSDAIDPHVLAVRLQALIRIHGNQPIPIENGAPGVYAYPIDKIQGIRRAIVSKGMGPLYTTPTGQWATRVTARRPLNERHAEEDVEQAYNAHRRIFGGNVNDLVQLARTTLGRNEYDMGDHGNLYNIIE